MTSEFIAACKWSIVIFSSLQNNNNNSNSHKCVFIMAWKNEIIVLFIKKKDKTISIIQVFVFPICNLFVILVVFFSQFIFYIQFDYLSVLSVCTFMAVWVYKFAIVYKSVFMPCVRMEKCSKWCDNTFNE